MAGSGLGDDDWGSNASTEDEAMEDADPNDIEGDPEAEEEEEEDDEIAEDDEAEEEEDLTDQHPTRAERREGSDINSLAISNVQPSRQELSAEQTSVNSKPLKIRYEARPEAVSAPYYDITPTMAAPQSTSINAITATPDMRYWFTGGSDCYIRKYDGIATINGKTLLTVAQRHPFVDSVTKAAVLMSYWDNEEPVQKPPGEDPSLSPVYSLAVQSEALWILSGLESGSINLYSVRHEEGKRIAYMHQHKSAVSVLNLAQDEKSVLSGSWDKKVIDWDLNTGQVKRSFEGSGGQISAIEIRPASTLAISEDSGEPLKMSENFSSNNDKKALSNIFSNSMNDGDPTEEAPGSQTDSLFGGSDTNSLFVETAAERLPSGGHFKDEDDEISAAAGIIPDSDEKLESHIDSVAEKDAHSTNILPADLTEELHSPIIDQTIDTNDNITSPKEVEAIPDVPVFQTQDALETSDSTFLAASIDGIIRIWDRRQPNPVAFIPNRAGVPPWCMAACWSPDGNFIYAGRRNGTVEEFSIHRGLKNAERTFKFPLESGAVSALRAMPNERSLICASHDILRLYDLKEPHAFKHSSVPFLIVPGPPRPGVIAALHIDPTCKYMISIAGNRGWEGSTTESLIGYEIAIPN